MNNFVIWIDREHAKVFQILPEKLEIKNLHVSRMDHHTHRQNNSDHQREEMGLFSEAVTHLKMAEGILILGPGVAKHHFQNYLAEHFPAIARKVAACEAADHPTDGQIAAFARKYFTASESA